jgi:hypothetical protein
MACPFQAQPWLSATGLTSSTADSDSWHDERSIGTWPPLCYVAICEVGPIWNRIALWLRHRGMPTAGLPLGAVLDKYNRPALLDHPHA